MGRDYVLRVRLSDEELAGLDAAAAQAGLTRARLVRRLLAGGRGAAETTPTRQEALGLLASAARKGSLPAAIALERSLRLSGEPVVAEAVKIGAIRLDELRPGELRVVR
jgi:hypothetical protein